MEIVISRQNPRFKEIKKLIADKKTREESQSFFVDGVNFVAQAIDNGWEIIELVYVPKKIDTEFKKEVLARVNEDRLFPIGEELYRSLSVKKDIQGVGAVVGMKVSSNRLLTGNGVVLERIANPGNLGSIARLCAAFEILNLYVIKPAVEFFHPEVVRASMGAIFHLNLVYFDSSEKIKEESSFTQFDSIGTSLQDDSITLESLKVDSRPKLIWFGSEAKGLTDEAKKTCSKLVKIPISTVVDSLNIAESAAIVLYEILKQ